MTVPAFMISGALWLFEKLPAGPLFFSPLGVLSAAAGAMNPWNDSVDSISLRGSTVRAGSEAGKAPGGFTPRTVNTDFRWKLGVLKAGEETPRGGKPPVWRNHKPAGSDANSMGEGSGQPQEGPPSQWRIPSTPKLQVPCPLSNAAAADAVLRASSQRQSLHFSSSYCPI